MKRFYQSLIDIFSRPWASTVPALATAVLGLVGGYFLWEFRTMQTPGAISTIGLGNRAAQKPVISLDVAEGGT